MALYLVDFALSHPVDGLVTLETSASAAATIVIFIAIEALALVRVSVIDVLRDVETLHLLELRVGHVTSLILSELDPVISILGIELGNSGLVSFPNLIALVHLLGRAVVLVVAGRKAIEIGPGLIGKVSCQAD